MEIDTEVVQLLIDTAAKDAATTARLTWNKALPTGVSKSDHYEGFAEILQDASTIIYNRTKKFAANYIIIAADIMNILVLMKGFTAAPVGEVCGPYFAGTINQLKVFVSPALNAGEYVVGVNGSDMRTSAAVYAPLNEYAFAA